MYSLLKLLTANERLKQQLKNDTENNKFIQDDVVWQRTRRT